MGDISIEGALGFYSILGLTQRGTDWINDNVQGAWRGVAHSDQSRMVEDIAQGASQAGLTVSVNGVLYSGGTR